MKLKARLARWLVRWASRWMQASYQAYMRVEEEGFPDWWEQRWTAGAVRVNKFAVPRALELDKDAAVEQMAQEGWWG